MNADAAIQSFRDAKSISDAHIIDHVAIAADTFRGLVHCNHCRFAKFTAPCTHFDKTVTFANCQFEYLDFYATYFFKGLVINECRVSNQLTFQSGGHNGKEHTFAITNTRFDSFVDFEDCWFTGPFRLQNVVFACGTNLLGNQNHPLAVRFDLPPEIANVEGALDVNTIC